jgi:hypothetical protein
VLVCFYNNGLENGIIMARMRWLNVFRKF